MTLTKTYRHLFDSNEEAEDFYHSLTKNMEEMLIEEKRYVTESGQGWCVHTVIRESLDQPTVIVCCSPRESLPP